MADQLFNFVQLSKDEKILLINKHLKYVEKIDCKSCCLQVQAKLMKGRMVTQSPSFRRM
jgi:hypothetical protein